MSSQERVATKNGSPLCLGVASKAWPADVKTKGTPGNRAEEGRTRQNVNVFCVSGRVANVLFIIAIEYALAAAKAFNFQ